MEVALNRLLCALLVSVLPAVLSCGGDSDPVGPFASGPMELTINSINPSDITAGIIDRDVSITSAAANLWASYIRLTTDLCGREPVGFSIGALALTLDLEGSVNVSALDDVIDGTVTVYFASTQGNDASAVRVDVGTGVVSGIGSVGLEEVSTRETLAALYDRMLSSDFRVGIRAETSRTDSDDFSMVVEVSFLARAFCE